MILAGQVIVLALLAVVVGLMLRQWPYPSPLIRPLLGARNRWPETQIRGWLDSGGFHPGYLRFFNRDPERIAPEGDAILAPADGLVTSAECRNGIRYIVIALSFWDMHVQRSPMAGRVTAVEQEGDVYTDGEGRDFAFLRDKLCPVHKRVCLQTTLGQVAVRLITSVAARRIETWVQPGEDLERGQRLGRILLGSTVVLEVPEALRCAVPIGTHVKAGLTPLIAKGADHA